MRFGNRGYISWVSKSWFYGEFELTKAKTQIQPCVWGCYDWDFLKSSIIVLRVSRWNKSDDRASLGAESRPLNYTRQHCPLLILHL